MKKKEAIKIFLFLMIFVWILISVSYIVRTNGNVKDRYAGFYAEKEDDIDILLVGSSAVGKAFAPGVIWENNGFTSYQLANNSQWTRAIPYLLEEAYKTQNPELVVIELRMYTEDYEEAKTDIVSIRGITDNMRYSLHRMRTIDALVETDAEPKLSFYLDIFKYHSNWKMLLLPEELAKFSYSKRSVDKGYESDAELNVHEGSWEQEYEERIPIAAKQEQELYILLDFLKKSEQQALFVVSPRYFDKQYQGQMNYMKDIVEQEGFQYLDMNAHCTEMEFDIRMDVTDGVHVNTSGAKKCSEYLGDYIESHYNIADKRGQSGYESWEESADEFIKHYQEYLDINKEKLKEIVGE